MRRGLLTRHRRQHCQSMVEFALIAPVLLLLIFGIIDFGRVIYVYVTMTQAANEGARVAIRYSPALPTNGVVESAVRSKAADVILANPCPNGPLTTSLAPPDNTGWVFITEPSAPATPETLSYLVANGIFDAPGGQASGSGPNASCSDINPAAGHVPLQVAIWYNFVPFTPLIRDLTGPIVIRTAATYRTEY